MKNLHIYWARRDFRLHDNKALAGAVSVCEGEAGEFLPVFVLENYMARADGSSQFGYPSRYVVAHAVPRFAEQFKEFLVLKGCGAQSLIEMIRTISRDFDSVTIHVNEDVYVDFYKQIAKIRSSGIVVVIYQDRLTVSHSVRTGQGNLYSVFTPFRNAVWNDFVVAAIAKKPALESLTYLAKDRLVKIKHTVECSVEVLWGLCSHKRIVVAGDVEYDLDDMLQTLPDLSEWYMDESAAHLHFARFLKTGIEYYNDKRDGLSASGTSHMSVALAWGFVSARILVHAIKKHFGSDFTSPYSTADNPGAIQYFNELIWREFYAYLVFHKPELMSLEFQEKFRGTIHWRDNKHAHEYFAAWIKGETGYPVVDAAMKEIQCTGVMHNRARMIVASFLTKHLGVDWRWGQEYFRAMLVDIDECSNNGGWQWGASVGADPKPIRIFNPTLQTDKYDHDCAYRTKWLGEAFDPKAYREPIVDHRQARNNALSRYKLSSKELDSVRDY